MSSSQTHLVLPLLSLLFLLQPIFFTGQNYRNVTLGRSLTAGDGTNNSWTSPSGDFAFGFSTLDNGTFLLSIWYNKIPEKTIVWYEDSNLKIPPKSVILLTTDGKFVVNDPQGKELWTAGAGGASYGAMLDNGNFVLVGSSSSSQYLWQSFNNPTDTILPTQVMGPNSVLYSRRTTNTFSKGRFRFRLTSDGNLVLNSVGFPSLTESQYDSYYESKTNNENSTNAVVFNKTGDIYVENTNGSKVDLKLKKTVTGTSDGVYYRATLDFDGVFTLYSHPRRSGSDKQGWLIVGSIPENICDSIGGGVGSGACGYNSYCLLTPDRRPSCECPRKYSFVDPNNTYGGCKPNFVQGCQLDEWKAQDDLFELETLDNIDWPTSDFERLEFYGEEECRNSCMNDCLCDVAIVRKGNCWKKKLPLSNGRYSLNMDGKALIKVRKGNFSNPFYPSPPVSREKKDRSSLIRVMSVLLGSSMFFNFLLFVAVLVLVLIFRNSKKSAKSNRDLSVPKSILRSFTYKELEVATSGFKEELGRGAYGIVYKGVIDEMGFRTFVAVKKLDKVMSEGDKEFKTEVNIIGKTHHKNLVQLLGFCEEGQDRILVYEFMNNRSLAEHIFGSSKPDWYQRVQIAFGVARGLVYLHEECNTQIIHCDIKPQNILLDDTFTAKISDFGVAKLLMKDQTRTRTGVRGTRGYVAAEWFRNTPITAKVDVYSYGVVLLEIICCRKSLQLEEGEEEKAILTDWAYDTYRDGNLKDLVENDECVINDMRTLERIVMIAIWCIQEEASLRPSMKKVIHMLEGVVAVPVPPCPYTINLSYMNTP